MTVNGCLAIDDAIGRSGSPAGIDDAIFASSADPLVVTNAAGTIVAANRAAYRTLVPVPVIGADFVAAWRPATGVMLGECLAAAAVGQNRRVSVGGEIGGGGHWWDVIASPLAMSLSDHVLFAFRNVTVQRRARLDAEMRAGRDALTGLGNRADFNMRWARAIVAARAEGSRVALLLVDLDDFKQVNDTRGHAAGDALLCAVAGRLHDHPEVAHAARLGGDEFALIVTNVADVAAAARVAETLAATLCAPQVIDGASLDCRASVGAALFPDHGDDGEAVLRAADLALYTAKAIGRGGFAVYTPGMRNRLDTRARQLALGREMLRNGGVEPAYQPKVDLASGRIVGFEALLRFRHADGGIGVPRAIAAALDDPEFGAALGERMQDLVFADIARWTADGVDVGRVAINAATADFRTADFAGRLLAKLDRYGLRPDQIELEVVETVFLEHQAAPIEAILARLANAGVTIALDDFGVGYASLTHLAAFPIEVIKIDRSFIVALGTSDRAAEIVKAIIALARALEMVTVAEGIETLDQARFVSAAGCTIAQGYLFGPGVPAGEVAAMVTGPPLFGGLAELRLMAQPR